LSPVIHERSALPFLVGKHCLFDCVAVCVIVEI
jgi:hypothetical protein